LPMHVRETTCASDSGGRASPQCERVAHLARRFFALNGKRELDSRCSDPLGTGACSARDEVHMHSSRGSAQHATLVETASRASVIRMRATEQASACVFTSPYEELSERRITGPAERCGERALKAVHEAVLP